MSIGKRKYLIIAFVAAIATISIIALLFLYPSAKGEPDGSKGSLRGLGSVPVDAAALFSFERFDSALEVLDGGANSLMSEVVFGRSKLSPFFKVLGVVEDKMRRRDESNSKTLLSIHYSAQNELSALLIISLQGEGKALFETEFKDRGATTHARSFNGVSLSRYGGVEYFISDTLLVASVSPLTIESSIRHLNTRSSIIDNEEFIRLYSKKQSSGSRLFVNHSQIGKIFSGLAGRSYLKHSDFVSRFASWSDYEITTSADRFAFTGNLTNDKGAGNYSQIFSGAESRKSGVASLLPSNTYSLVTISAKDLETLSEKYGDYSKYHRRYNEESWRVSMAWFGSLNAKSISLATIPYGGVFEYVTIIERPGRGFLSRIFGKRERAPVIEEFSGEGHLATLFGGIFLQNRGSLSMDIDGWTIIGSKPIIEEFSKGSFSLFTMEEYLSQTKMKELLSNDRALLSVIINGSEFPDSLTAILRGDNRVGVDAVNKSKNLRILSLDLYDTKEKGLTVKGSYYADSVEVMPLPIKKDPEGGVLGWELDTIVSVPKGPFELVNPTNGTKEYLTQLNNNWLRFSDKSGKGLWSAPFQEPIKGYVEQIDFYNNGKLQMLFATTDQLHLLDKTGRFVSPPFPKKINYDIVLGPKVYNLRGESSPALMLLHTDNVLRLYDKHGVGSRSWREITTEETIKEFPELVEINGNSYWILRSAVKCMVYSINGEAVTETEGNNRLRRDTEIIPLEGSKVKITSITGKEYRLDLETGKLDRKL